MTMSEESPSASEIICENAQIALVLIMRRLRVFEYEDKSANFSQTSFSLLFLALFAKKCYICASKTPVFQGCFSQECEISKCHATFAKF